MRHDCGGIVPGAPVRGARERCSRDGAAPLAWDPLRGTRAGRSVLSQRHPFDGPLGSGSQPPPTLSRAGQRSISASVAASITTVMPLIRPTTRPWLGLSVVHPESHGQVGESSAGDDGGWCMSLSKPNGALVDGGMCWPAMAPSNSTVSTTSCPAGSPSWCGVHMPAVSRDHPIETPVRRPSLKNGTTTATQPLFRAMPRRSHRRTTDVRIRGFPR